MATYDEIMALIKTLPITEQQMVRSTLNQMAKSRDNTNFVADRRFSGGYVCPSCGCTHIVRNGHRADGTQRYLCRDCKVSFISTSESLTNYSKKEIDTWKKYISCMMLGLSVRKSAQICGIHRHTAFRWRHKILDSLQGMANSVTLNGIVEADETFFEVSYKGNHKNSKTFKMPRNPHKRGHDHDYELKELTKIETLHRQYSKRELNHFIDTLYGNEYIPWSKSNDGSFEDFLIEYLSIEPMTVKEIVNNPRGLSNSKVCVPCAINRDGLSIAKVAKLGKVSTEALEKVFENRIEKDTTLCTDKEKAYRPFSKENGYKLEQIEGRQTKKGIYHIQHINSYHSTLDGFLIPFKGVATKYLNNYLIWHNMVNYGDTDMVQKENDFFEYVITTKFTEKNDELPNRPALPLLVGE